MKSMRLRHFLTLVLATLLPCGCGSKISQANYYRVQYGMTEEDVEDLLGPPHEVRERPTATQPVVQKVQTWKRGGLVIRVVFEQGVVVGRSAEGIAAETAPPTQKASSTPT